MTAALIVLGILAGFALLNYLSWSVFYQRTMAEWHPDDHRQLVDLYRAFWMPWRGSDD